MLKKILLATLLMTASLVAQADEPKSKGAYIGASVGLSIFDDDNGLGIFNDDEDTAFQGYLGYKFFKYLGVEARYADFGGFSDGFDTLELKSRSIHAIAFIPFGTSGVEMFGQLGLAEIDQSVAGFGSEDDSALSGGIGVRWHVTPAFVVGAQIDAFVWENDNLGSGYDLSLATNQLTFQINF